MTATPAAEPATVTVLVGLHREHLADAAERGLPTVPFMADMLSTHHGWTEVRARSTGEVHNLPPVYVLTPVIPISD